MSIVSKKKLVRFKKFLKLKIATKKLSMAFVAMKTNFGSRGQNKKNVGKVKKLEIRCYKSFFRHKVQPCGQCYDR
jgi:hypothetical protein